jgi:hypothetical protein
MGIVDIVGSNKRLVIGETLNEEDQKKHDNQPKKNHHATATAGTGTGVADCDGGEPGASASLLNICDAESVGLNGLQFFGSCVPSQKQAPIAHH